MQKRGCKKTTIENASARHLATAILLQSFDDLAAPKSTASVYVAFFYTDYCKGLFDLAGIAYDRWKIAQKIAERPKRINQVTKKYFYGRFTFDVVDGYIVEITDEHRNLYHFERVGSKKDIVSYYYDSSRTQLSRGRIVLAEGV